MKQTAMLHLSTAVCEAYILEGKLRFFVCGASEAGAATDCGQESDQPSGLILVNRPEENREKGA